MKVNKELIKGSTTMLILKLLEEEEMYGYQMIKRLSELSDETFNLKEGTLYPILHTLDSQGMIESFWEKTESARKRKYYRITKRGKQLLMDKVAEWRVYNNAIQKVIGGICIE